MIQCGHGGGDKGLIRDLLDLVSGKGQDSPSLTTLERSLESHYVALGHEESRLADGMPVDLKDLIAKK